MCNRTPQQSSSLACCDHQVQQRPQQECANDDDHAVIAPASNKRALSTRFSPALQATLAMAMASSLNYCALECSRAATMDLFLASFKSSKAMPLCTICGSPFALFVLHLYSRALQTRGPKISLTGSTLLYAASLAVGAALIFVLDPDSLYFRATAFLLMLSQNGLVQLLTTQHWSFLGFVCVDKMWFAPIAGLGSLASTGAAVAVSVVLRKVGLTGLLLTACPVLVASAGCAHLAYRIAEQNGIEPTKSKSKSSRSAEKPTSLVQTASKLFRRTPILGSLALEVLLCQCVSSLIHFMFVNAMRELEDPAHFSSRCFALVNATSGVLQFLVLPLLVRRMDVCRLWLLMPCLMWVCATFLISSSTDHTLVAVSFWLYKSLEYSVRGVVAETIYSSLDYDSRFLGKEIVDVLANRAGKSGMAVAIFVVTSWLGDDASPFLARALSVSSFFWLVASFPLAQNQRTKQKQL